MGLVDNYASRFHRLVLIPDDTYQNIYDGMDTTVPKRNRDPLSLPICERWEDAPITAVSVPYEINMYRKCKNIPEKEILPLFQVRNLLQMSVIMYDQLIKNAIPYISNDNVKKYVKTDELNFFLTQHRSCTIESIPYHSLHLNEVLLRPIDISWYFSIKLDEVPDLEQQGLPVYIFGHRNQYTYEADNIPNFVKRYRYPDIIYWITNHWKKIELKNLPNVFLESKEVMNVKKRLIFSRKETK